MQTVKPLAALAATLVLAFGAPGVAAAQSAAHDGHDAAAPALVLNDGAKWQGDQNMIDGMAAIRGTLADNLDAIHSGTLSADAAKDIAAKVEPQVNFMIENCVLTPAVDEQFHLVLAQIMDGTSLLGSGDTAQEGAVRIVEAVIAYGDHFHHPGWQPLR